MTKIIGVKLDNRIETAVDFQKIITSFGCEIKTRLGLHQTEGCENYGIILLEVKEDSFEMLFSKLSEKWLCKKLEF